MGQDSHISYTLTNQKISLKIIKSFIKPHVKAGDVLNIHEPNMQMRIHLVSECKFKSRQNNTFCEPSKHKNIHRNKIPYT